MKMMSNSMSTRVLVGALVLAVLGLSAVAEVDTSVTIAGLYDEDNYDWAEELIDFTVRLINDHNNGWFDDVLKGTKLEYTISNAACDPNTAVRAFMDIVTEETPPNAILGCRCSGATVATASIAAALDIAMLSMAASTAKLSDTAKYPTFSRLVPPDNAEGQVGALIKLLRRFDWDQINIIQTEAPYAQDFSVELKEAWERDHDEDEDKYTGEANGGGTVQFLPGTEKVDPASVEQQMDLMTGLKTPRKSRVVVLLAHAHHASEILEVAEKLYPQSDTIWIGVDGWTGSLPVADSDTSWMPDIPGYIGIVPYKDETSPTYIDFMRRLQEDQRANDRPVMEDLPVSSAHRTVDSVLALASAMSMLPQAQRSNGTAITQALTYVSFQGVSGPVEFNDKGDWTNATFTVMTLPKRGEKWIRLGHVTPDTATIDVSKICWAKIGCNQSIPNEKFDVPPNILVIGLSTGIGFLVFAGIVFYILYPKSSRRKIKELEAAIQAVNSNEDSNQAHRGRLCREMASLLGQPPPAEWIVGTNVLIDIPPSNEEYWNILDKMRATSEVGPGNKTCYITSLSRVQNEGIWSYCVFRKNQLANKHDMEMDDLPEEEVWHGTSGLNPDVIYKDQQDGFMINYSQQGLFGRGIYFADRFGYSDSYSYRVNGVEQEPDDDREMFLVKLLVGKAVSLDHGLNDIACKSLVAPPAMPGDAGGLKYDTVTGEVDKTKIHVVYENGRAFPEYLIRYYKGNRDPLRTPFETRIEALGAPQNMRRSMRQSLRKLSVRSNTCIEMPPIGDNTSTTMDEEEDSALIDVEAKSQSQPSEAHWMYYAGDGQPSLILDEQWSPCSADISFQIEAVYHRVQNPTLTITTDHWSYKVDLVSMTQTNLHTGTSRRLRRVEGKEDDSALIDVEANSQPQPSEAHWMYYAGDGQPSLILDEQWSPCSADISFQIEAAYHCVHNATLTIATNHQSYNVDLVSMTQTNLHTGTSRRLRRVEDKVP